MKNIENVFRRKERVGAAALFVIFVITAGFPMSGGVLAAGSPSFSAPESFSKLAEAVSPAVVNIRAIKTSKGGGRVFRDFFKGPFGQDDQMKDFFEKFFGEDNQREFKQRSLGSGFIIDQDGYIVTNNHVIEDAEKVQVKLKSGAEFEAEIVGRDPNTDLALIKVKSSEKLPFVNLGNSEILKVGQWVIAIGSPFGLEQTVTAGIVSAKGRVIGSGPYDDFIQTDASINPGNSGGPLLNMNGEVVGINTAIIASGQGIGFAIPINMAKGVIKQLQNEGEVTRGWLGVGIQDLSKEVAEYYGIKSGKGVIIAEVFEGDPADKAGIKQKDIILEVNGEKLETSRDLTRMIAGIPVGKIVTVKILREGKELNVKVSVAKRNDKKLASRSSVKPPDEELGIRVSELTAEIKTRFNLADSEGVIVVATTPDGKGEKAGLLAGDIIKEINHQPVKTLEDYTRIIQAVKPADPIQVFLRRMNVGFLVVRLTK
ncbi:MAG: DegQ family serine endoprotease [Desulfobacterales bacterium]|nr:DegQ family serine endoprotease [Desulfobacterales bacterium]